MDLPNNSFTIWPPYFAPPPVPMSTIPSVNDELFTNDFIIQCINKQKELANGKLDAADDITLYCSDFNNIDCDLQYPRKKRAKLSHSIRKKNGSLYPPGILRNLNIHHHVHRDISPAILQDATDEFWLNATIQNNKMNLKVQEKWRGTLAIPTDLSMKNRSSLCSGINENWISRYGQKYHLIPSNAKKAINPKRVQILLPQQFSHIDKTSTITNIPRQLSKNTENGVARPTKRFLT